MSQRLKPVHLSHPRGYRMSWYMWLKCFHPVENNKTSNVFHQSELKINQCYFLLNQTVDFRKFQYFVQNIFRILWKYKQGQREEQRAERLSQRRSHVQFPLVEKGIGRDNCIEIIKHASWPIPIKSGCFLCPFQRTSQWEKLARVHPDLLKKAIMLEKHCAERLKTQNRPPFYLAHPYPVRVMASGRYARKLWNKQQKGQMNLWGLADLEQCPYCQV